MVGDLQFAVGAMVGVQLVVESTVGEGTAKSFVDKQEEQRDLNPFWR